MTNFAIRGSQREIADDGPHSETIEFEQDRFNRLVNLQSELFDLIVNTGVGVERLKSVIGKIKNSFFADGAILLSFAKETDGRSGKYICSTDGVERATIDEFVVAEKPIAPVGKFGKFQHNDGPTGAPLQGTFWAETINDIDDDIARAGIILLFGNECEPSAIDRLALKAISPLVRVIADAVGNEEALKSANDRFASLASSIPGVVYQRVVTPDGDIRYTYISETAKDLFGVSAEEILADPHALFDIFAPEYANNFQERLIKASKDLSVWDVEASFVTKDGQLKYTHAIATPQKQADDSVLWTGVILDATRIKKEAEIAAAETEARTRETIVESLSQGFLLYNSDDKLMLRNSHFSSIYPELADVAVPGASYADILHAELALGLDAAQCSRSLYDKFTERVAMRASEDGYVLERQISEDCWVLTKEYRTSEGTVVLYTDISEIKQREQRIQYMAHHDALTGLPNRALFQSRVKDAITKAQRHGTKIAIACLDLDNFKNVNDSLGHSVGDALLCEVAKRIQLHSREAHTVARLGGDEFAILLTHFQEADYLHSAAERILKSLALPIDIDGRETVTGASMGIAQLSDATAEPHRLLTNAESALCRAKINGRNTYRFFEPEMDEIALFRRKIELDLRLAIEKDEFELYYQPLVNVLDNRIASFEALIRWNHPERGLVSPDEFIGIAEETTLVVSLGEWALKTACDAASRWCEPVKVAVNISPIQFKQNCLVELVTETLQQTSLDPSQLELEITESVLMQNSAETMDTLHRLKKLGVHIAMDDFGTGYSSLGNLLSFPFDKIKIDRSFVSNLETNPGAVAIVRAAIGLGRSLGVNVVAEGVETRDQLAYLRIEGCAEIQGHYYSEPRPGNEVNNLLKMGPDGMETARRESTA